MLPNQMIPPEPPAFGTPSTGPTEFRPHEFFLIRYLPDVVRGEFVNIGVIVREIHPEGQGSVRRAGVRITRDWTRVSCYFPDSDLDFLEGMEEEFQGWLHDVATGEDDPISEFDKKVEQLSLTVQITEPQACLTADLNVQLSLLMRLYVDSVDMPTVPTKSTVLSALRSTLDLTGPWHRTPHGASQQYIGRGDTLIFDYLYRTEVAIQVIQAIAVGDGVEQALALAYRMDKLREGVLRVEGKPLEMTVVVETPPYPVPGGSDAEEGYHFAVSVMKGAGIRVVTTADLQNLAETIRRGSLERK